MLDAIEFAFGGQVHFEGRFHGAVPFIAVVAMMITAEELVVRVYRHLGDKPVINLNSRLPVVVPVPAPASLPLRRPGPALTPGR